MRLLSSRAMAMLGWLEIKGDPPVTQDSHSWEVRSPEELVC